MAREGESTPDGWSRRKYVTAQDAADYLSVHVRTVYNYANRGTLKPHYLAGSRALRFLRTDVESMIDGEEEGEGA